MNLELRFEISDEQFADMQLEMQQKNCANPVFEYGFYDVQDILCTYITCRVAIRPEGYIPRTRK